MRSADAADGSRGSGSGAGDADEPTGGRRSAKKKSSFWRELPILVVLALGLALLIKTFLVQAFFIPSESMEQTLIPGDRVLVNKLAYRFGDIRRGDVIVFNGANSWAPEVQLQEPSSAVGQGLQAVGQLFGFTPVGEKDFIKRVIGLPGDRVTYNPEIGRVTVNGKPLAEADYLFPGDKPSQQPFDIVVPEGHLWVMGDHRAASSDSRGHMGDPGGGAIPTEDVVGRAFVIVWPLDRAAVLSRPDAFTEAGLAAPAPMSPPVERPPVAIGRGDSDLAAGTP